jgi:tetratricopeptide (TPR) repeat protein
MCKEAGNRALTGKDFHAAHDSYTEGIRLIPERSELPENKSLEQDLHRNRSHVRLALGRYEGAVEDAMAALTHISDEKHQKLDAKAYFRASSALYELKLYDRAAVSIRHELELFPGDIDAKIRLERVQCRLREQEQGSYDIERIQKSISKKPHVDAADSIVNTVIKTSGPERGRGLFATRSLKTGDLVMAETAFCSVWSHEHNSLVAYECDARSPDEIHPGLSGLWRSAVNEVEKNPSKGKDLLGLHGKYSGTNTQVNQVDGVAVVDTFKVYDIVTCNSFSLLGASGAGGSENGDSDGDSGIFFGSPI